MSSEWNPEGDFVLRGRSPKIWLKKPGEAVNGTTSYQYAYTSTMMKPLPSSTYPTLKSKSAKNTTKTNCVSVVRHTKSRENLNDKSRDNLIDKNKTFVIDKAPESKDDEEVEAYMNQSYFGGKAKLPSQSEWFTSPVHLTSSDDYPVYRKLGLSTRSFAPVKRDVGSLGAEIAAKQSVHDSLMEEYKGCEALLNSMNISDVDPDFGYSSIYSSLRKMNDRSTQGEMSRCNTTAGYPVTTVASTLISTPYQSEIARLKMEQLRLEEERMLEWKRQAELERIRGPKPKWYELKSPAFHYEAHKNNELLRSYGALNELWSYHQQLTRASHDFQQSLGAVI